MLQEKNFLTSLETIYSNIKDEGVILSIGDGIVKASGLRNVIAGEMVVMGMALNLEHDLVGIVVCIFILFLTIGFVYE